MPYRCLDIICPLTCRSPCNIITIINTLFVTDGKQRKQFLSNSKRDSRGKNSEAKSEVEIMQETMTNNEDAIEETG